MKNKTALVTGGSRGIGLGIAEALTKDGFNVAINGMRPESQVGEVLDHLRSNGTEIIYCQGDIGSEEGRKNIWDAFSAKFDTVNLLVNNAGVAPKTRLDILETTPESVEYVLNTNLKGSFFMTQMVANHLVEQKKADSSFEGMIVNITSISSTVLSVNRGEYCIAKAGLSMCSQLFAARLGEFDIPVYEVRPGVIKTDMTSGVTDKYDKLIAEGLCVQPRWGFPDDVGKAVASLARRDFPFSTGQVIMIDGGLTLPRL